MKSIPEEQNLLDGVQERTGGRSARVRESVLHAAKQILMEHGAESLTHRNIAKGAGVNASTVYRRWPDRARLIADVFKSTADSMVGLPDTGCLSTDLFIFLQEISNMLSSPEGRKLAQSGIVAVSSEDKVVREAIKTLWNHRFQQAETMFDKAVDRGQEGYQGKRRVILETLIAPIWFRNLVSLESFDEKYLSENINRILALNTIRTSISE